MNRMAKLALLIAAPLFVATTLTVTLANSTTMDTAATSTLVEYPVPGSPQNIAVESPGKVWFTLSDQNMIGRLAVTSTVDYEIITYTVTTTNSVPYDLVYADSMIWFTEYTGNQIGRLDPSTGNIDEFAIPTANSAPTGIDVAPNGQVWFVERDGNNLARLVVTSTADYTVTEFAYTYTPSPGEPGELQSVAVENDNRIWFTAPGVDCLVNFRPIKWPDPDAFYDCPTGGGSTPWGVAVGDGYPWVSAYGADRLGRYLPHTGGDWAWYSISSNSGPTGIDFDTENGYDRIWFVAKDSGRVGLLETISSQGTKVRLIEFPLPSPNSAPEGIAVDSSDHVWIAETGANKIAEWRPPYVLSIYLPLVIKQ
jgi:virginiamycin B lyase